jgi:hypothetical protein
VFTGSGDGIVQLTKNTPGPAAVRISGNQTSNHFEVRALGTRDVVVVTTGPYQGVRPLDWDGGNSTGFEVTTTGPWRIEVMPLSAMPTFDKSFKGEGDQVIRFTGDGSVAEITPTDNGRIFNVFTLNPNGSHRSILNPHGGWGQIDSGPQFIVDHFDHVACSRQFPGSALVARGGRHCERSGGDSCVRAQRRRGGASRSA